MQKAGGALEPELRPDPAQCGRLRHPVATCGIAAGAAGRGGLQDLEPERALAAPRPLRGQRKGRLVGTENIAKRTGRL